MPVSDGEREAESSTTTASAVAADVVARAGVAVRTRIGLLGWRGAATVGGAGVAGRAGVADVAFVDFLLRDLPMFPRACVVKQSSRGLTSA